MEFEKWNKRNIAFASGFSLVGMAITAGFSFGYAINQIFVSGNAELTFNNIIQHNLLFRLGILGLLIIALLDILVSGLFYLYFKETNRNISLLTALFRICYSSVFIFAILQFCFVLILTKDSDYLSSLPKEKIILFIMEGFNQIFAICLMIFAFHLLGLGYLVLISKEIPNILGILLILASFCYLGTSTGSLLIADYGRYKSTIDSIVALPSAIGELAIAFWLIWKGGKV